MRQWIEFLPVWLLAQTLRFLPRPLAHGCGRALGMTVYLLHGRLRRVGRRNLEMAFPEMPPEERERILKGVYHSLGRQLAEVAKFPDYRERSVDRIAIYDGVEHYHEAKARGKGVIFLTGHVGGWELSSFVHSLHGHWLNIVARSLDNSLLDRWVKQRREMHGNKVHDKDEYARGLLAAMRRGETVGVLMDTNMTPPQGVFVDFFGRKACTASGVARVAKRTGAAVVPAFAIWDDALGKYRLHLEAAIPTVCTGDDESDAIANTQNYTAAIERIIRAHPEQWLWVHRRWKTRPPGEPPLY